MAISRALTSELDLGDVLRIIVQASVEFISGRAGAIVLADPIDHTFRIAAIYGLPREHFERYVPLLQGLPYEEGSENEAIPELTWRMQKVAQAAEIGVAQVLRLPMMSGETLIGMIYVFQAGNYHISSDAAGLLQSFADQAAIAVKNARLYQEVIAEKQRLDAILEQSADGIMILGPQLEITRFNPALSRMTGWDAAGAVGRPHEELIRWQKLRTDQDLETALANGWPLPGAVHLYVEGELLRRDNKLISLGITYAPLLNHRGVMTSIIANVRDLTRYREEEALQKTFISIVSHELKTPVSIIKGYAGTLRRRDAHWSADVQDEYLAVIEEEADNLADLIDNLLEASRLQSGTFKLELNDEVDLPKLAAETVRKFSSQTDRHNFVLDFPPDYPMALGDERRLTQVFNNLVSNAIKYSPDGGQIVIRGEVHANYVTVSVQDQGIGIPAHQHHKIFEKFSRLDNALSRNTDGTGLGLFLTKAIVEAHGGSIWFHSNERPTNGNPPGTTFTFSLPRENRS
ncbi:MAG: ATP-binding protein [Chloroflexi bacterium]|nr:ATP-binding protein [Chloroflexota bacterium]MCI0580994.1 ATP-binding protein [Chloroflexota bacterium]MCI0646333.1 ATP-binding protein [Chloroflexota bacterium]MCI0726969.1 ATP-binding protein [Chloroflexota bacterium]